MKLTPIQQEVLASAIARKDGAAPPREGSTPAGVAKITAGLLARKLAREIKREEGAPIWRRDKSRRPLSLVITSAGRKLLAELAASELDLQGESTAENTGDHSEIDPAERTSDARENNADIPSELQAAPLLINEGQPASALADAAQIISDDAPLPHIGEVEGAASAGGVPQPLDDAAAGQPEAHPVASLDALANKPRATKQTLIVNLLERDDGVSLDELVAATGWQAHSARAALTGLRKRGRSVERFVGSGGGSRYRLTANGAERS